VSRPALQTALSLALLLGGALAPMSSARAATVAVVLDRSASLRYADPEGGALRALTQALALALRPDDRLAILGPDAQQEPRPVGTDAKALAARLRAVLTARPQPGGAHLQPLLERACGLVGKLGVVVVYGDDDLDVIDSEGRVPPPVLALAQQDSGDPARDDLNRAARLLLRKAIRSRTPAPRLVALVAPLPGGARGTPYLKAIGAQRVPLTPRCAAALADAIRGTPVVGQPIEILPGQATLDLPYPARVTIVAKEPLQLAQGTPLDEERTLWLIDVDGALPLSPRRNPVIAYVAPRLPKPADVIVYRLADGSLRAIAKAAPPSGRLVLFAGESRADLSGTPPTGDLSGAPPTDTEAEVALVLGKPGERGVEGPRARIAIKPASAVLEASGTPQVDATLKLEATLPQSIVLETLELEIRDGGGRQVVVALKVEGGVARGTYVAKAAGALSVRARGPVAVAFRSPVQIRPLPRYALVIRGLSAKGEGVDLTHPLELDPEGSATLQVELAIEPAPPKPIEVELGLDGIEGAALGAESGAPLGKLSLSGKAHTLSVVVVVPPGEGARALSLTVRPTAGGAQPTSEPIPLKPARSWTRLAIAGGLLAVALLWIVLLWWARRREKVFVAEEVASKQLRTLGTNGRLSPERYMFADHLVSEEEGIFLEPEDSPGGSLVLNVRPDGKIECVAKDGAKLIHEDRPTVLAESLVLEHGTAFAMVSGNRALRYVYLDDDPDADELAKRWVADGVSYEGEIRDSGVFVLLDDDQNLPKTSARLDASTELFPSSHGFESSDDVHVVPSDSGRQYPVSDEGIVVMNSDEGRILDSDEVEMLMDTDLDQVAGSVDELSESDEALLADSDAELIQDSDSGISMDDILGG
jgi:hypothetical protein